MALVLLLVRYALFWSTPTVLRAVELLLYVLELRVPVLLRTPLVLAVVLLLLYLGDVPRVFTFDLALKLRAELLFAMELVL